MSLVKNIKASSYRLYLQTYRELAVRRAPFEHVGRHHQVVLNFAHSLRTMPEHLRATTLRHLKERFIETVSGTERSFYGPLSTHDLGLVQELREARTDIESQLDSLGDGEGFTGRVADLEEALRRFFRQEETELFNLAVDHFQVDEGEALLASYRSAPHEEHRETA